MKIQAQLFSIGLLTGVMLPIGAQAALKQPDQVKTCLRLMMQVTNDFDRQITRKTYARLPHENMEFQEASAALRKALEGEPTDFKAKADPAIQKALDAAQKEANDSAGGDETKLRADHGQLLQAVNAVFAYFPVDMRPDPNVQPGRGPASPSP
jgi:hypothetical protein